jgi:hypothetical protein
MPGPVEERQDEFLLQSLVSLVKNPFCADGARAVPDCHVQPDGPPELLLLCTVPLGAQRQGQGCCNIWVAVKL